MSVIVPKRTLHDLMDDELYRNESLFNFNQQQEKIFNDYSDPNQLNFIQPNKLLLNQHVNDALTNFGMKFKSGMLDHNKTSISESQGNTKSGRIVPPKRKFKTLTPIGKFDDYLFNPNIEPSSSINFNYGNFNYNDDSILVHHDNMEIFNDLHNYVDEDLSEFDDEEDDDDEDGNHFYDFMEDEYNIPTFEASVSNNSTNKEYLEDMSHYDYNSSLAHINMGDVVINDVVMNDVEMNDINMDEVDINHDLNEVDISPINVNDVHMNDINDNFAYNDNDEDNSSSDVLSLDGIDIDDTSNDELDLNDPLSSSHGKFHSHKKVKDIKKEPDDISDTDKQQAENDHVCMLINPNTGNQCNKQFSRPYDLIRHQETIHASLKKIFRCVICEGRLDGGRGNGKSKTFSRGDALSRHIKVKHQLMGKDALELINNAKDNVEYVSVNS